MTEEPRVEVTQDGPYRVVGDLPLVRTAQVETEYGEPVDWEPDTRIETTTTPYELCRCGRSARQPFCDATHEREPFDGAEVADPGAIEERAYPYRGGSLTMFDDRTLCTRAGYCGDRFRNVWAMIADAADPEVAERIRHMSMLCPSGRLATQPDGAEARDELDYAPSVVVIRDGPLWLRGGVQVVAADGRTYQVRNRTTLCRCGHSGNKPFCDGSHEDAGFREG
ncbi:MAG: CDGSH iron-sulfur domain-containing protein [Actinomycetota bacterium]